jgi:hypothetical protein
MKKTKKAYEQYLNELSPAQGSDEWIIGGKIRMSHMWKDWYGTALRKFDPIAFQVGYNEWVRENK